VTEEEINNIPVTTELIIDTELCEQWEDIKTFYWEDIDKLTDDRFDLEEFDISILGFNLDIPQTITAATYIEEKAEAEQTADYEEEIKRWQSNMLRG
jgi:hypothetical protein